MKNLKKKYIELLFIKILDKSYLSKHLKLFLNFDLKIKYDFIYYIFKKILNINMTSLNIMLRLTSKL